MLRPLYDERIAADIFGEFDEVFEIKLGGDKWNIFGQQSHSFDFA